MRSEPTHPPLSLGSRYLSRLLGQPPSPVWAWLGLVSGFSLLPCGNIHTFCGSASVLLRPDGLEGEGRRGAELKGLEDSGLLAPSLRGPVWSLGWGWVHWPLQQLSGSFPPPYLAQTAFTWETNRLEF